MAALAVVAIAATPSSAGAFGYEHHYCGNTLAPGGTCPPNGSSTWAHLELNEADAGGESHETCIDEYLDPSGTGYYTGATCMYYAGEETKQFPGGTYGYPRAWNGGSVTHYVAATEYGYKTGAASSKPASSPAQGAATGSLPSAVVEGLDGGSQSVSASTAEPAGGTYPTWIVSGAGETCLIVEAIWAGDVPAGVCGPTSAAEARGLAMTREDALGQPVVVGLAPTGNSSVTVTNSDGTSERVAVTNSVYEVTQGDPASVKLKNAAGQTTTRRLPALSLVPASAPAL
ncbi:MAG TPA: hypothetical protein VN618_15605 [Solirubrobacteraceae bacterium]|nr:hypothetical protein [Solirubrobacteraceae bacterium]